MSSWSSFKEDKAIVDKWRSFLQERQYSQEEIDKLSNLLVPALQTYAEAPREQRQQMLNQIDQYIEMLKNKGFPEEAVAAAVEDAKKEVADEKGTKPDLNQIDAGEPDPEPVEPDPEPVEPDPEPVEPDPEPEEADRDEGGSPDEEEGGEETEVSNDPIPLFDENDTEYLRARISQSLKSQGIERDGALRGVINNIIKDLANQLQNNKLTVKEAMVFGDSYLEEEEQLLQEKDYINLYKDAYKLLRKEYGMGQDTIKRIFRTMDRTQAMSSMKTSASYRNDKSLELTKALLKKLKVKGPEDSAKLKKKLGKIFRERGGLERVFSEMGVGKTKTGGYVTSQEGRIDVGRAIGGKLKTYLSAPRFNRFSAQEKQKIIKTVIMMSKQFLNKEFAKRNIEDIKINETLQRWQLIAGIKKVL